MSDKSFDGIDAFFETSWISDRVIKSASRKNLFGDETYAPEIPDRVCVRSAKGLITFDFQVRRSSAGYELSGSVNERTPASENGHLHLGRAHSKSGGSSVLCADIEIRWPSGIHQVVRGVRADQFIVVEESGQP